MKKIRFGCFVCALMGISISNAQSVEVRGKVIAEDEDLEGIHVINKTASKFTITNSNGEFIIPANVNDTILFSAIKYKPKEVIINSQIIKSKTLTVYLTELVNELNQVIVGKVLTGNLLSDVENSDAKRDLDFYDFGIPGYTGKPLTQSENRLNEATTGGGFLPLNPILNYFSGRTKMLKNQVKLERLEGCLEVVKANLSKIFFEYNELDENLRSDFFYFCSEDEVFPTLCQIKNDLRTLEFLKVKLEAYKSNIQANKE